MGFTFSLKMVGTKILVPGSWYQDLGTKIFGGTSLERWRDPRARPVQITTRWSKLQPDGPNYNQAFQKTVQITTSNEAKH